MLSQKRQKEIFALATQVNTISENYQLLHATFAVEEIFRERINTQYDRKLAVLRQKLKEPSLSKEGQDRLVQKFQDLRDQASKKQTIRVNYIPQIKEDSARITKTVNNTFYASQSHGEYTAKRWQN